MTSIITVRRVVSTQMARLAGLYPAGVICEIVNDDGTMAHVPDLGRCCQRHDLVMVSVADLERYRSKCDDARAFEGVTVPAEWEYVR